MVDITVIALETPVVAVERSDVMVVVGLPDVSPALMVRVSAAEVLAIVVMDGMVVEGTLDTTVLTGFCEDPAVVCSWRAVIVVFSVAGIVRKMITICSSK